MSDANVVKELVAQAAEHRNPLLGMKPRFFETAEEWLARWREAKIAWDYLGLLYGLQCEKGRMRAWTRNSQIVSILLEIADCNREYSSYLEVKADGNQYECRNFGELRKYIADSAFKVLCLHYLEGPQGACDPLWFWMVEDETLFQKVLWFLRPKGPNMRYIDHHSAILEKSVLHQLGIFRHFASYFAGLGWSIRCDSWYKNRKPENYTPVQRRLFAARPKFIEILNELGELDFLISEELDDASLAKLKELAFADERRFPSFESRFGEVVRHPVTLEEAVAADSPAAQILLIKSVRTPEMARIRELSGKVEQALEIRMQKEKLEKQEAALKGS